MIRPSDIIHLPYAVICEVTTTELFTRPAVPTFAPLIMVCALPAMLLPVRLCDQLQLRPAEVM